MYTELVNAPREEPPTPAEMKTPKIHMHINVKEATPKAKGDAQREREGNAPETRGGDREKKEEEEKDANVAVSTTERLLLGVRRRRQVQDGAIDDCSIFSISSVSSLDSRALRKSMDVRRVREARFQTSRDEDDETKTTTTPPRDRRHARQGLDENQITM